MILNVHSGHTTLSLNPPSKSHLHAIFACFIGSPPKPCKTCVTAGGRIFKLASCAKSSANSFGSTTTCPDTGGYTILYQS